MKKIILLLSVAIFCCCKQNRSNLIQESRLPDLQNIAGDSSAKKDSLENGYWRYTVDNELVKSGKYKNGYKTGIWEYQIDGNMQNLYWVVYRDSLITINHPKSWKIDRRQNRFFYSIVNREKKDFFLINRYDKKEFNIGLDDYFKEAISTLGQKDNKILGYLCIKLEYENRNAYYLRFDAEYENNRTAYYNFYTEDNDFVYDCAFRVRGEGKKLNKEIFAAMVYSLNVKGEKFFHNNDRMMTTTQIRIEDLN